MTNQLRNQIRKILKAETAIDQDELLEQIDAPNDKILSELRHLMQQGKISYDIDWNIDGRGKTYTSGLIEEND